MDRFYHLYDVEYISCEGNRRTANVIIESENDEVSADTAQSVYYSNSDAWGDSPAQMVSGYLITTFSSCEEMNSYCASQNIFAETYNID
jgi:ABC-type uncharacterized transport system auxiliary subunit